MFAVWWRLYFSDQRSWQSPGTKLSLQGRRAGRMVIMTKEPLGIFDARLDTDIDTILAIRLWAQPLKETIRIYIYMYVPSINLPYYKDKNIASNITVPDDILLNFQGRYPQEVVVICDDMNARIGSWDLHTESDKYDEESDNSASQFICTNFNFQRVSKHKPVNRFDTQLKNFCKVYHG